MTPQELATEVDAFIRQCTDRITGIGAQQYHVDGQPQKFETMEFDALAEYYEEELRDIANYAAMTHIRLKRLREAFVPWVTDPNNLDTMQSSIGSWGDETFSTSNADSVLSHLREEIDEFFVVAPTMPDNPKYDEAEEAADVFLLLLHFAHKKGFSLAAAADRKMTINRRRVWSTDAEPGGHFKHVKPAEPEISRWEAEGSRPIPEGGSDAR